MTPKTQKQMIDGEIEKLLSEFGKFYESNHLKHRDCNTRSGECACEIPELKSFFESSLKEIAQKTAEAMVIEEEKPQFHRGQVGKGECQCKTHLLSKGWNSAREEQIKRKEELLQNE